MGISPHAKRSFFCKNPYYIFHKWIYKKYVGQGCVTHCFYDERECEHCEVSQGKINGKWVDYDS